MKNVKKSKFFALIFIFLLVLIIFLQKSPSLQNFLISVNLTQNSNYSTQNKSENIGQNLVKFEGNIEHFFTHQIVNNPKIAFNKENKYRFNFYRDCVTSTEFQRFLEQMFENNYILVDIYDCYEVTLQKVIKKDLFIPKNKKPFILSFDDMSFDTRGKGMSDKLILDENKKIASQTSDSEVKIEYDKESIPILEDFISKNPSFSFNGARGIICPTGYNGILGYRINKENTNRTSEIEKLKPLVARLKELGYRFASHTYGHICVGKTDIQTLKIDTQKYEDEIIPIIGKTDILSFPCGSFTNNKEKLKILKDAGFRIFLCVGTSKQERFEDEFLYLKRHVLDGEALIKYQKQLSPIIDTSKIYDYVERNV